MKIAFITDDEKTISQHFGRAAYYLVIEVDDGVEIGREVRNKTSPHFGGLVGGEHHVDPQHDSKDGHGMDAASHKKHEGMAEIINDCDTLVCGGMGRGAYLSMESLGIKPIVTQIKSIDEALQAYLSGELDDETGLLH